MRTILQRVSSAKVRVDGEVVGEIGRGILALVGVENGDGARDAAATAKKMAELRLFEDGEGRMNLETSAVSGAFLVVSQFTLAASLRKGRRPSFNGAAPPATAGRAGTATPRRRRSSPRASGNRPSTTRPSTSPT